MIQRVYIHLRFLHVDSFSSAGWLTLPCLEEAANVIMRRQDGELRYRGLAIK